MTRLGTSLPLCRGSFPVRYLVGLFLPWHLPAAALEASRPAIKTAFWNYWETARFGPNPGREPFGARFWQFAGFPAASKRAFWDYWETAVLGQILAGSALEPEFGNLEASRPAIKSAFWDYWETAVFEPNPGRELFGAKFWQCGSLQASK